MEIQHIHTETTDLLPGFSDTSRVWIYAADRVFSDAEVDEIVKEGNAYAAEWQAHKKLLNGGFKLFFKQFVVLVVDEAQHAASGCSIDDSVHFVKGLETKFKVKLTERMLFSFFGEEDDTIYTAHLNDMRDLLEKNKLSFLSPVFDNLVDTKADFNSRWIAPLKDTWMMRFAD